MSRYTPLGIAVDVAREFLDEIYGKKSQYEDSGFPLHMRAEGVELLMQQAYADECQYWVIRGATEEEEALLARFDAIYLDLKKSMRHTDRARERA